MPEFNKSEEYSSPQLRLVYDIDWGDGKYSITTEVPFGKADFKDGTSVSGLGDIRIRYFHRLYEASDPGSALQNMVFSLDVFAPTGDAGEGAGLGTWLMAPTLIFSLPLSDNWAVYPAPKFKFSTGKTEGRSSAFYPGRSSIPNREEEDYIRALEVEAYFTRFFDNGSWFFVDPIVEWDLTPEPNEDNYEFTMKGQLGRMFGRWGLGAEATVFVAGEKSQDYQLRGIFFYYL
jgi:hypothetical protein